MNNLNIFLAIFDTIAYTIDIRKRENHGTLQGKRGDTRESTARVKQWEVFHHKEASTSTLKTE